MKPFNLEEAKAGKPMVTRDGRQAKFIAHVPEVSSYARLVVLIGGALNIYRDCGSDCFVDGARHCNSRNDLFMAPVKKTAWVELFDDGSALFHPTKSAAFEYTSTRTVARFEVTYEKGQGLS